MRRVLAVALALAIYGIAPAAQQFALEVRVEPEKTRFARGERVFLWLAVSSAEQDILVPSSLLRESRLFLTRPDGTQRIDTVGAPIDGMPAFARHRGGWALNEPPQFGRYTAVYDVAGQRSAPVSFTVEDVNLLVRITARFVVPSPLVADSPDAMVTFVVRNNSDQTVRFVDLGQPTLQPGAVSGRLTRSGDPNWSRWFRVDSSVFRSGLAPKSPRVFDTSLRWSMMDDIEFVTVRSGATYELRFPLRTALVNGDVLALAATGEYGVEFSAEIPMLVGERDGPLRDFSPLLVRVASDAR